ncbi:hypothetical protein Astex_3205 [Asticcacaulis excentricus CB 48]|uniref:Uncharacterized protein n=1 Tax=Asticcacaulis excentricus (strain ATCC 15261 / DSM 4724 / KCTC 12464 / NCIMB 9791 / VKM B-1370 / CB 48) TaxID=573065 RepID=E8RTL9_ASTEC|nr:hypothetical protein Astex_3205 [Asticcacaulis excentricus CB 48]
MPCETPAESRLTRADPPLRPEGLAAEEKGTTMRERDRPPTDRRGETTGNALCRSARRVVKGLSRKQAQMCEERAVRMANGPRVHRTKSRAHRPPFGFTVWTRPPARVDANAVSGRRAMTRKRHVHWLMRCVFPKHHVCDYQRRNPPPPCCAAITGESYTSTALYPIPEATGRI